MVDLVNKFHTSLRHQKPIGWDDRTLRQMLEESERLFGETGCYWGLRDLSLKEGNPLRYEKIFAKLRGGLVNARETAKNISASPIVRELGELCFAIYTPEGDSIALSTGIIVHVHTMSDAIKFMVRHDYEMNPGISPRDLFTNNDPLIGDVHNADVQTFVPIFHKGELVAWAGGVTHVLDIGAVTPGGVPVGPTNRFEDGLDLPAVKCGANDTLFQDHIRRCETAVRTPMYWKLDERCRIAGCHMIRDTIERVITEEGIDIFKQFIREVIEEGRRSFRNRVKEMLVPGIYRAPAFFDMRYGEDPNWPVSSRRNLFVHGAVELRVGSEGNFHLDYDGSSAWGQHSMNCGPSPMQGALWVLLTQTMIPNDKVNDGAYLATTSNFPSGTWTNPDSHMASTGAAWGTLIPSFTGLICSLSRAFYSRGYVEEVLASYGLTGNVMQGGGTDQFGNPLAFTNFELSSVGTGAGVVRDGLDHAAAMWNPEGDMGDMEVWELLEPLIYLGRCVKPNTAGAGKYRGGSGFEALHMVWGSTNVQIQNAGNGKTFMGGGLYGGYPSATGYRHIVLNNDLQKRFRNREPYPLADGDPEQSQVEALVKGEALFDKITLTYPDSVKPYDLYLSMYRGGAGVGDPLEREPERIATDLNNNVLLPRYAEQIYGAVVRQDAAGVWSVDIHATEERRRAMREQRRARAMPVKQYLEQERERIQARDCIEPVKQMYRESMKLSDRWGKEYREFWQLPETFEY